MSLKTTNTPSVDLSSYFNPTSKSLASMAGNPFISARNPGGDMPSGAGIAAAGPMQAGNLPGMVPKKNILNMRRPAQQTSMRPGMMGAQTALPFQF